MRVYQCMSVRESECDCLELRKFFQLIKIHNGVDFLILFGICCQKSNFKISISLEHFTVD